MPEHVVIVEPLEYFSAFGGGRLRVRDLEDVLDHEITFGVILVVVQTRIDVAHYKREFLAFLREIVDIISLRGLLQLLKFDRNHVLKISQRALLQ
jgi:hypothetical protein